MTPLVADEGPSTGHMDKLHLMCPWLSTQPSLGLPFRKCKRPKSARQIGIEAQHSSLAQRNRLVGPRFDLLNFNLQIRFVSLVLYSCTAKARTVNIQASGPQSQDTESTG